MAAASFLSTALPRFAPVGGRRPATSVSTGRVTIGCPLQLHGADRQGQVRQCSATGQYHLAMVGNGRGTLTPRVDVQFQRGVGALEALGLTVVQRRRGGRRQKHRMHLGSGQASDRRGQHAHVPGRPDLSAGRDDGCRIRRALVATAALNPFVPKGHGNKKASPILIIVAMLRQDDSGAVTCG